MAGCLAVPWAGPAAAGWSTAPGYASRLLYSTAPGHFIGGLDISGEEAFIGVGTNVLAVALNGGGIRPAGSLPSPNTGVSYLKWRDGELHAAYAQNFNFPPLYRRGVLEEAGSFTDHGELAGIYDAAVDSTGNLFIMAYPSFDGSRIYRHEPATTTLTEVVFLGGFSGGMAFDSQDRLYVAEQTQGNILRFTPGQLATGGLVAASGEFVATAKASYLCFDHHDRLYAVTGYGNELSVHDSETGVRLRTVALDPGGGYGIGWIGWDRERRRLLAVYTDYYVTSASELHAITFAPPDQGIPGTSTVFRGWIAGYQDFTRPEESSGGYARDDHYEPTTPGGAIIGRPAHFDPEDGTTHVLSLGNGGTITLTFDDAIANGPGPDFAVFENGFHFGDVMFAELAFVEVATSTNAWARFPATYYGTNAVHEFGGIDVTGVDGLAGKHLLPFGTPFDLEWLRHQTNVLNGSVDLNRIAYVRITDAVGDGSTRDQFGTPIRDPNGPFFSMVDGFDLRAVGVVHLAGITMVRENAGPAIAWYGYEGRPYQPQVFSGGDWQNLGGPVPGTGGVHLATLPDDLGAALIRIHQQIPAQP